MVESGGLESFSPRSAAASPKTLACMSPMEFGAMGDLHFGRTGVASGGQTRTQMCHPIITRAVPTKVMRLDLRGTSARTQFGMVSTAVCDKVEVVLN